MTVKYQAGDRVTMVDSPYSARIPNGTRGVLLGVTMLPADRVHCVYFQPEDPELRSETRADGTWVLYPREIKHTPQDRPEPGSKRNPILAEFGRGCGRHKWQRAGRHKITSYRSFRRYRAAGAAFCVIPFQCETRTPEKDPVMVSVNVARRRAQAGLQLYAIVSEVK